ncbi:calcium-activated chloride channel-domain-containing protein [Mycotypha africana]|uniref:calcium-activated chloride channel-domain-containing protein n=1 Tax=Mycotypha africana TaxID=64632 RepID=UPI002301A66D|nr:calcium-activated chloride channel-domain-containing protein [Mycotypha africana]KAI8987519.1 calcium-activated chloride channel-domain-containing protein [Mycotypha africana]
MTNNPTPISNAPPSAEPASGGDFSEPAPTLTSSNLERSNNDAKPTSSKSEVEQAARSATDKAHDNAGVDYVIVFTYPTKIPKGDKKITNKAELEADVTESLKSLTTRLAKVSLRFQVRPGETDGTFLIMVGSPLSTLKQEYRRERIHDFLFGVRFDELTDGSQNTHKIDTDFENLTDAERLRLVYELMTEPQSESGAGISIETEKYVEAIIPLHDEKFNKKWLDYLPKKWVLDDNDLTTIRDHFGERVAYYFAFVQTYTWCLTIPAIVGIVSFLIQRKGVSIWFSVFMLLWSVAFYELWDRKENEYAIRWGVRNVSKHEKRRIDFVGEKLVKDDVTGEEVPYVPGWKLVLRRLSSLPVVFFGALFLTGLTAAVVCFQLFIKEYYNGPMKQILGFTPLIGFSLIIPIVTKLYAKLVKVLCDFEMHKTHRSWEHSYTQKVFVANFLAAYLALFITGWIYIPFGAKVTPYLTAWNIKHDHNTIDFTRLRTQLIYLVATAQVVNFVTEMVVPWILAKATGKAKNVTDKITRRKSFDEKLGVTEKDDEEHEFIERVKQEVALKDYDIFLEYVEIVIQFGYVSMFSSVFPLTALFSLINNWIEIRGDATKLCYYTRRPLPHRGDSIGPWKGNMKSLIWLSSITMGSYAYLFHPSTNIHSPHTLVYTLVAILFSEHLYLALRSLVRYIMKFLPSWADNAVRKEEFEVKKTFLERMVGDHNKFLKRSIENQDDANDISDKISMKVWNNRLDRNSQIDEAIQLVQKAFKTQ